MHRGPVLLGVICGLAAAAGVLSLVGTGPTPPPVNPHGPILADCGGPIRELVIQYTTDSAEIVLPVYREFLSKLPREVTVHVVCPDRAAFVDLQTRLGPVVCKLSPVAAGHAMTAWSRDRWVALTPHATGGRTMLLAPRDEASAETWPQRAGDRRVAEDLAAALPDVTWLRSGLHFDGGDFVADERAVFATPAVARRNIQHTVEDRKELLDLLREQLGRRVILLADAPNHHAGMFMMPVGHNTILVGDPRLAREAMGDQPLGEDVMPPGLDLSDATQQNFDAVARRCEAAGYRVVRIPVVPGLDGRTYLTYLNVILDERDEARIVYMPVYHHVAALNAAAGEVWRQLGYLVRPVDCSTAYKHGGSLRCLVNVVSRG